MDIEKLIQEINSRSPIWDQKSTLHHNRDVVAKCWQEVATACEITVEVAKAKWKHLRDNFRVECKKKGKKRSGDPGCSPAEHQSSWVWFKSLLFLKDQVVPRKMSSNLPKLTTDSADEVFEDSQLSTQHENLEEEVEVEAENVNIDTDQVPVAIESTPKAQRNAGGKRARNVTDNELLNIEKKKIKLIESHLSSSKKSEPQDDLYHFLMSLHKPLGNLSTDRQMFLRFKIQELIYNEMSNSQNYQQHVVLPSSSLEQNLQYSGPPSTSSVYSHSSVTSDGYLINHYE